MEESKNKVHKRMIERIFVESEINCYDRNICHGEMKD